MSFREPTVKKFSECLKGLTYTTGLDFQDFNDPSWEVDWKSLGASSLLWINLQNKSVVKRYAHREMWTVKQMLVAQFKYHKLLHLCGRGICPSSSIF